MRINPVRFAQGCGLPTATVVELFLHAVNTAARVQALSRAGEIVVTDDVLSLAGAAELVTDLQIESGSVELRGIAGDVRVHRLRAATVGASSVRGKGDAAA